MRFLNRSLYKKRFLTSVVCVLLSWTTSASVAGSPAGMAMDIQGQAQQSTAGNKSPVKLLDYIQPGTSLELAEKSSLSLTLYNEKKLYRFQGPANFEITETGQVKLLSGSEPSIKPLGERVMAASQQGNFIPGSTRMRSAMAPVVLLAPAKGGMLTESPRFMWASAQQGPYLFKLIGPEGKVVWEKSVAEKEISLPGDVKLQSGVQYKWQVSMEKGHGKSERSQFALADPAQVKALREGAPAASAPIEEQVMYAIDLRDNGFFEESEKVIGIIRKTRPDMAEAILSSEP